MHCFIIYFLIFLLFPEKDGWCTVSECTELRRRCPVDFFQLLQIQPSSPRGGCTGQKTTGESSIFIQYLIFLVANFCDIYWNVVLACIKGLFEKRFAKMPEEIVSVSPSKGATGKSISDSSSLDKSDLAEQLASKRDELQGQAGAEQVGFCIPLWVAVWLQNGSVCNFKSRSPPSQLVFNATGTHFQHANLCHMNTAGSHDPSRTITDLLTVRLVK